MNNTKESLQNTWGVVESKEHAEFIVELAELHGFECGVYDGSRDEFFYCDEDYLGFISSAEIASNRGEKQITIPLPPKAKEWPQVGDEVEVSHDSGQVLKGELLAITSEYAIIQQLGHEQHLYLSAWKFSKPKTPEEELRDKSSDITQNEKRNKSKQAYEILKSLDYEYDSDKQKWFKKEYI